MSTGSAGTVKGSLLLLEHVNLNVGSAALAKTFYIRGIGCCEDPFRAAKCKSLHCNVGAHCQFHTAGPEHESYIAAEGPQVWRGEIVVVYRTKGEAQEAGTRLRELALSELKETAIRVEAQSSSVRVTCPFGNKFVLREATGQVEAAPMPSRVRRLSAQEAEGLDDKNGRRQGSEGSAPLGIASLVLSCPDGAARVKEDDMATWL
eukprot:753311-Hanusia_phi.AAC.3